jgi:hypothetical protein
LAQTRQSDDLQAVAVGEVNERVRPLEGPLAFGRLDLRRLHAVLRRDDAELRQQEAMVRDALGDAVVDADADVEEVFGRLFQARLLRRVRSLCPRSAGRCDQGQRPCKVPKDSHGGH